MQIVIAILGYGLVAAATGALIWAMAELERGTDVTRHWQPGTKPHIWRV